MNREKKLPAVVMKKVMKKTVVMKKPVVTGRAAWRRTEGEAGVAGGRQAKPWPRACLTNVVRSQHGRTNGRRLPVLRDRPFIPFTTGPLISNNAYLTYS